MKKDSKTRLFEVMGRLDESGEPSKKLKVPVADIAKVGK